MHIIFLFSKPMKQQLKKEISMQHSRGARELRNTFSWDEVRSRRGDRLTPCAMDSLSEQQAEEQHQEEAPRATWTRKCGQSGDLALSLQAKEEISIHKHIQCLLLPIKAS